MPHKQPRPGREATAAGRYPYHRRMDFIHQLASALPLALGPSWLEPEHLIKTFGTIGVLAIVFIESGLLVGFFLPGDSLLFTAGLLSANGTLPDIWILLATIPVAAIAGDQVGYAIGRRFGPPLFNRPESRFFRREYVDRSAEFFEKHGPKTVVLARFVPIVRTFVPVMAGTSKMHYRTFVTYNVIGGLLWGVGVTALGYFLGQVEFVKSNIEPILLLIVFVSVIPVFLELFRQRRIRPDEPIEPFETPVIEDTDPVEVDLEPR